MKSEDKTANEIETRQEYDTGWLFACGLITAIAVGLRFINLGLKPFHHDEGVNGWFLTNLFRDGVYKYDPANYHGPTLYYITLAFVNVFGLETVPARWSVAIWGVLIVVLAFWLRRYIGKTGSLFAALFLALSPGMVYISRYFIHEIFFVFLALGVVIALMQFIEREKAGPFAIGWTGLLLLVCFFPSTLRLAEFVSDSGTTVRFVLQVAFFVIEAVLVLMVLRMLMAWRDGRPVYFLLASASISLMFATKETAFITLGTMLIAILCVMAWEKISGMKAVSKTDTNRLILILILPLLAVVYAYDTVWEGILWFYENFAKGTNEDAGVRYLIVILTMSAIVAFVAYVIYRSDVNNAENEYDDPTWAKFRTGLGSGIDLLLIFLSAAVAFIYIWILFFTSFFTYPEGVAKSLEAYAIWTKTGTKDHTQSGTFGYLKWMMEIDAPLIILSALGLLIAFFRVRHRFALFAGLWALGLFIAYSIIPYKTPWLMLSFTLPMCIAAGYAINELAASKDLYNRTAAAFLAVVACIVLAWQTYDLNFVNFDNERLPYVYAHTDREFLDMVQEIERFAELSGEGKEAAIHIVSPDYWPLVWYLRDYKNTGFHGRMADPNGAEIIVAKKNAQEAEAARHFSNDYLQYASYKLRPGVELMLFVRKDIASLAR